MTEAPTRLKSPKWRSILGIVALVCVVAVVGVYCCVIVPAREDASALAAQLDALQREQEQAEQALAAAQASGASEEELERLRDQLVRAQESQRTGASTTGSSSMRLPYATPTTGTTPSCMGPLCGLMRTTGSVQSIGLDDDPN